MDSFTISKFKINFFFGISKSSNAKNDQQISSFNKTFDINPILGN